MESEAEDTALDLRASEFVKAVLESAHSALTDSKYSKEAGHEIRNIDWMSCRDFSIEGGKAQIEEYIKTWEMHPGWLFSVQFLQETELEFKVQFDYRALWSLPTRRSPIPAHTAAVNFTIEISKTTSQTRPVQVYFQVESNRTVHEPGKTRFRQKWLKDVIESKSLLMDTVNF